MSDLVGRMLDQYEILDEIAHGGMSYVYRAIQPSVGREVAIKVLPAHFLQDQGFLGRFSREIKVIAQLQHPRILPVYDSGVYDGMPYIVMAYMAGGTLADRIKEAPQGLPMDEVLRLTAQIAEGLDYAHEQGIIHRDFKPSNVLMDLKDHVYLADFGIAVQIDQTPLTSDGLIGTPQYMAPELGGSGNVTSAIDIYALGVTLFEMITGSQPFKGDTPVGIMLAHTTQAVPDARELRSRLPSAVQEVISWGMAKDPQQRPGSAGELARMLERAMTIAGPDTAVMSPPAARDQTLTAPRRRKSDKALLEREIDEAASEDSPGTAFVPPLADAEAPGGEPPGLRLRIPLAALAIAAVVVVAVLIGAVLLIESLLKGSSAGPGLTSVPPIADLTPVARNADWEPVIQAFAGVDMVLVPPGCFTMGSDSGDQKPAQQQCFDHPFWIDRTEVTNGQFARFGGSAASASHWPDANRPRERITWFEAAAFCTLRGARLPTEAEWEYAARGPDGLTFPWGATFIPEDLVYAKNSGNQTADVGSKPAGASWVGALDMSGNVYEWVSSLYLPYPYNAGDGREDASDRTHQRVLRGGAWYQATPALFGTAARTGDSPSATFDYIGVRCARSD